VSVKTDIKLNLEWVLFDYPAPSCRYAAENENSRYVYYKHGKVNFSFSRMTVLHVVSWAKIDKLS